MVLSDQGENLFKNSVRIPRGIDQEHPFGIPLGQELVAFSDFLMKRQILGFEPSPLLLVFPVVPFNRSLEAHLDLQIQDQGEIGGPEFQDFGQPVNAIEADTARVTLVGQRGVMITITNHVDSLIQGRFDDFLQVLISIGKIEQQLRPGFSSSSVLLQKDPTNFLAEGSPTGLLSPDEGASKPAPLLLQQIQLTALARAFDPFQGDELTWF